MNPSNIKLFRITPCDCCDGEGEPLVVTSISRDDGRPDGHRVRCEACNGTGAVYVELAPIELYDLPPPVGD